MTPIERFFIACIVIGCLFMIFRKFLLWYFKIDKRLAVAEEIRDELKKLNGYNSE